MRARLNPRVQLHGRLECQRRPMSPLRRRRRQWHAMQLVPSDATNIRHFELRSLASTEGIESIEKTLHWAPGKNNLQNIAYGTDQEQDKPASVASWNYVRS